MSTRAGTTISRRFGAKVFSRVRFAAAAVAAAAALSVPACTDNAGTQAGCQPVALAFVGPLSGPEAQSGEVVRNAAALAVGEHNDLEGKCDVGLVSFDTQGDPQRAGVLARQIVADPQVIAVVGPVFSGETEAVMPVFEQAGLPVVTPSATNPGLGQQGWEMFHRVVGTDAAQGPAAARWLAEQAEVRTVAVIDDGSLYGRGLADAVVDDLDRRGLTIAPRQRVEPERRDYGDVVGGVQAVDADAVFFGGLPEAGIQLFSQMRGAGVDAVFMGGDGVFMESFEQAVAATDNPGVVVVTCPCVGTATTPSQRAFAERYADAFGRQPFNFAAEGFDAATMLLAGIDDGATTRSAMADWLSGATHSGITKRITFGPDGEIVDGPVFFFAPADGRLSLVGQLANDRLVDLTP